jgi:hypothetical protein
MTNKSRALYKHVKLIFTNQPIRLSDFSRKLNLKMSARNGT